MLLLNTYIAAPLWNLRWRNIPVQPPPSETAIHERIFKPLQGLYYRLQASLNGYAYHLKLEHIGSRFAWECAKFAVILRQFIASQSLIRDVPILGKTTNPALKRCYKIHFHVLVRHNVFVIFIPNLYIILNRRKRQINAWPRCAAAGN